MRDYMGLYQGIVVSTQDPENKRRITAQVPDVLGQTESAWARPGSIINYPLAPGSRVWIRFPNSDLRYPVYYVPDDPNHGHIVPGKDALGVHGPGAAGVTLDADVHAKKKDGGYVRVLASDFVIVGGGGSGFTIMSTETSVGEAISDMAQTIADLEQQVSDLEDELEDVKLDVEFLMSIFGE